MISQADILRSYRKFIKSKDKKQDVREFMLKAEDELVRLYDDISNGLYRHGSYQYFTIYDTKKREIHKTEIRDRIVHQLVYDYLNGIYDKSFYYHSYAARKGKGTYQAINALKLMARSASRGNRRRIFILKLDIRKFFASVDKMILLKLLSGRKLNSQYSLLIKEIIRGFHPERPRGIPLGNLTSQIFANIYLNELDRFIKYDLKAEYYLRYMDDLILLGGRRDQLSDYELKIEKFLLQRLNLRLRGEYHFKKSKQGIDFLGYVIFPHHTILRTKTKRRMLKRANKNNLASYLGLLCHCRGHSIKLRLINDILED